MLGTGRKDGNISVHDSVYKNLRDKILYGFLRPGESLTLRSLASEFKTSMTPVRDSVRRLTAEGALKISLSGRITIPVLTIERFNELLSIRSMIESELAFKALPRAHIALIDRLESINLDMEMFARSFEAMEYIRANMEFHRSLYLRAQSPIMLSILENIWLQLGPTVKHALGENWNIVEQSEHKNILSALNNQDSSELIFLIKKDVLGCQNIFI